MSYTYCLGADHTWHDNFAKSLIHDQQSRRGRCNRRESPGVLAITMFRSRCRALHPLPLKPPAASGRLSPQTVLIELLPRYRERVTGNNVRNKEGTIER